MSSPTPAETIRAAGLRVTAPRQAVFEVLAERTDHPDVEQITTNTRARIGKVSHQTVYDVLSAFERADLVRCIDPAGSVAARYELQRHDNHHHLVCRSCHHIQDVPCRTEGVPCMHPAEDFGFSVELAEVVYWGLCDRCQAAVAGADQPAAKASVEQSAG